MSSRAFRTTTRRWRQLERRLACLLATLAVMLTATWLPAQTAERVSPIHELKWRFDDIQEEVDRLKKTGDTKAAAALAAQLKALTDRLQGPYPLIESDEPQVHVVSIAEGTTAPEGVLKGKDRFTTGYAEVKVTYTARPIILVLGAKEPVLWKVKPAEGVRFHAVILGGYKTQNVIGLPEHTLVLRRIRSEGSGTLYWARSYIDRSFDALNVSLRRFTGHEIATYVGLEKPINRLMVVGPENVNWRAHHILVDAKKLHERAMQFRRTQQLAAVSKLRFRAVHYLRVDTEEHYNDHRGVAIAEHTVLGPISSTLKPVAGGDLYHMVYDEKEKLHFALQKYRLVIASEAGKEPQRVPGGVEMRRGELTSLTIDTKRRRLLMSAVYEPRCLIAFDLEKASWSRVAKLDRIVNALTYVPELDIFYAITRRERDHEATIYKFAPDGRRLAEIHPSQSIDTSPPQFGSVQLIHLDGKLIVITPPLRDPWGRFVNRLYVIDAKSGEVLYSGISQSHDADSAPRHDLAKPPPAGGGHLDRLSKGFAVARKVARQLEERGEKDQAQKVRQRIAALQVQLYQGKEEASAETEVHVVGAYNAEGAVVEVAHTTHPVILVLCAYDAARWTIKVADDVKLKRVILAGYHRQTAIGVPEGVRVDSYNREDRTGGFYTRRIGGPAYDNVWKQLKKLTGTTKGTLQTTYANRSVSVRIGAHNTDWRMWRVVDRLSEIARITGKEEKQERLAELKKIRFKALYRRPRERAPAGAPAPFDPFRRSQRVELGEFTIDGPVVHSLEPFKAQVTEVVADGQGKTWYGRGRSGLVQIDVKTGKLTEIALDPALPRFSHLAAIAYDTKRRRVLLTSHDGRGYVYLYDTENKKWSLLRKPGFRGATAMVWDEKTDAIYTLATSHGVEARAQIAVYNSHGALLQQVLISRHIANLQSHPHLPKIQIRYLDGHLAILHSIYSENQRDLTPHVHVVDLKDGRVIYSGSLRPHATYEKLAVEELEKLWIALGSADAAAADKLAWRLAAGRGDTVKYLQKRLTQSGTVDAKQLKQLIAALGNERFSVREAAQKKIAAIGSVLEDDLKKTRQGAGAEVRSRIDALLTKWENAKTDPGAQREQRAMQALERIGTPQALKLLEELAAGASTPRRARAAQAALKRVGGQ